VRLFDGALAPTESVSKYFYESTPIEKEKKLMAVFKEVRDYIAEKMERTTLADVA
jgi:DNA-binding IscR family transcriptional regulator